MLLSVDFLFKGMVFTGFRMNVSKKI